MMPSRRVLRPVVLGGAAAALLAGTAAAYAGWSVPSPAAAVTLRSAGLPAGGRPVASAAGSDVRLTWPRVTIVPGVDVTGYRLVRSGERGADHTVCRTAATNCTDRNVPAGTWTYTVRPVQGTRWIGTPGPASEPVTVTHGGQQGGAGLLAAAQPPATPTTEPGSGPAPSPTPVETGVATATPAPTTPAATGPATTSPATTSPSANLATGSAAAS